MKFFKNRFNPEKVKEITVITRERKIRDCAHKLGLNSSHIGLFDREKGPGLDFSFFNKDSYLQWRWIGEIRFWEPNKFYVTSQENKQKSLELVIELQKTLKEKFTLVNMYD